MTVAYLPVQREVMFIGVRLSAMTARGVSHAPVPRNALLFHGLRHVPFGHGRSIMGFSQVNPSALLRFRLSPGCRLRRRQFCGEPARYPSLHGLSAHGGRIQFSVAVAPAGRGAGAGFLVSGCAPVGQRLYLRTPIPGPEKAVIPIRRITQSGSCSSCSVKASAGR